MDHEYDVLGGYIPSFVRHLKDTGARLGLRVESQVKEGRTSAGDAVKEVAEVHALSSWTQAEHDAFFRAISVHSRWRPDLIAACVPTRTEWEVWMYLEALEQGAATLATSQDGDDVIMEDGLGDDRRDVDTQVDGSYSDSHSHSGSDTDEGLNSDLCEPALEVSQAWIDVEERMASWIVREEYLVSLDSVADADMEDVDDEAPKRKRGRPRGAGRGHAHSRIQEQTVSSKGCHSPPPVHRSSSANPTPTSVRDREVFMAHLGPPHLMVLDGILREYEEAMKEKNKGREGSAATPIEPGDAGAPAEVLSSSHRISDPQRTGNVPESPSDVVIDPVLLALSGGADPAGCRLGRVPSKSTLTDCASAHVPTQDPSSLANATSQQTSPEASPQPGTNNMFAFPLGGAPPTSPDPTANVESDLSLFSPRSRRRIQKRLYMRRKRASLRENGAASEDAVHAGIDRLKPGKKAGLERSESSLVSTCVPCSEVISDAETGLPENAAKKSKAGLTLPYKLKARFAELGIDAAYLRSQGMDLLNFGALGKLMGLYSSLERGEEGADGSAMATSIDADLIRHLQAAMVMFVTDVMHRVIVWREREIRLKQRSRAWRHGDQITIGAVEHAVEAIGARYHTHKEYFKSLGILHTEPSNTSEEPVPGAEPLVLSRHRDVYTPLVHPPSAWRMGPLGSLTRTYQEEATRTRRGTRADVAEEELMSDEADDEALEAELEEEAKTDVRDNALGAREEEDLWARLDNHVEGGVRAW